MIQQVISKGKVLGTVLSLAALVGCSSLGLGGNNSQAMHADTSVPAARGEVMAKEGDNGNTEMRVQVEHLAPPEAIVDDAKTYVVWAQDSENGERVQNLGALRVDEKLKGELRAVTPLKRFDIFITPEPVATADTPSGDRVLWTTVTR